MELHFIILIALSVIVLLLILLIICTYCCCVDVCFWGDFQALGTRGFDTRTSTTKSKYSSKGSYGGDYYANSTQTLPSSASLAYPTREDHHSTPLLRKEAYHPQESDKQRKTSYPSHDGFYFPLPPGKEERVQYNISTLIDSDPRPPAYRSPPVASYIINQSFDQKDGPKNVETVEHQQTVYHHPESTPQGDAYLVERYPPRSIYYGEPFLDDVERVGREKTSYHLQPENVALRGPPSSNVATVERKETIYHHPYTLSENSAPRSNTVERKETTYHRPYSPPEDVAPRGSLPSNVGTVERKEVIYYHPHSHPESTLHRGCPSSNVETVETTYHHPYSHLENVAHRGPPPGNVKIVQREETIHHRPYRGSSPRHEVTYENNPAQTVYYREEVKGATLPRGSTQNPHYQEEMHQRTLPQGTTKTVERIYTVKSSQAPSKVGGNVSETIYYSESPVSHQKESAFRNDTAIANPSGVVQNGSYQNGYSKHSTYAIEGNASSSFARRGSQSSLYDNN